jgi:hypothetical protein
MQRRRYTRKLLEPIHVTDMQTVDERRSLARYGTLRNASASGLLIEVSRRDLSPEMRRHPLPLDTIAGKHIMMTIVEMNLQIDGRIVRTHHAAPGVVEIAVDFTDHAPPYWRECLAELLPAPGEMDQAGPA